MSSWIKMRTDLRGDPRVRAITLACFGEDAAAFPRNVSCVTGALHALWSLGDQYTTTGELKTYTAGGLDAFVGIKGFAKALSSSEVDWLEVLDKCLVIKRFSEHNGASAKQRAQATRRVQKHRERVTPEPLPEKIREDKREERPPNPPQAGGSGAAAKRRRSPKGAPAELPGFSAFWDEYPDCERRVDRAACLRHWHRAGLESVAEQVMAGLRRWKASETWKRGYVPLTLTFLHQKRWETNVGTNGSSESPAPVNSPRIYADL